MAIQHAHLRRPGDPAGIQQRWERVERALTASRYGPWKAGQSSPVIVGATTYDFDGAEGTVNGTGTGLSLEQFWQRIEEHLTDWWTTRFHAANLAFADVVTTIRVDGMAERLISTGDPFPEAYQRRHRFRLIGQPVNADRYMVVRRVTDLVLVVRRISGDAMVTRATTTLTLRSRLDQDDYDAMTDGQRPTARAAARRAANPIPFEID